MTTEVVEIYNIIEGQVWSTWAFGWDSAFSGLGKQHLLGKEQVMQGEGLQPVFFYRTSRQKTGREPKSEGLPLQVFLVFRISGISEYSS